MESRLTVIRMEKQVYVDGEALEVDVTELPEYFAALQWYPDGDPPYGEIEYAPDRNGRRLPNTRFNDIAPYKFLVDRHAERKVAVAAAAAAVVKR